MVALVLSLAVVSIAWLLAALTLMRAGRWRPEPSERFDAIVVLGCRVLPDRTPSPALERRIALGCELLRSGYAPRLVLSGGRVGGPVTEADAAHAHIASRSLAPVEAIALEREARNTVDNARLTRALLGDVRVLVVTCAWHAPRAGRVFARAFTHARCAGAPGRIRGALREVPAWLWSRARAD